jgi:hypothetical protein
VCCSAVSEMVRCRDLNSEAQVQSQCRQCDKKLHLIRLGVYRRTEIVVSVYRSTEVVVGVYCQSPFH